MVAEGITLAGLAVALDMLELGTQPEGENECTVSGKPGLAVNMTSAAVCPKLTTVSHSVVPAVVVDNDLKAPPNSQNDKRHSSPCPPRVLSPNQVSS